jgi:hypothetical protein
MQFTCWLIYTYYLHTTAAGVKLPSICYTLNSLSTWLSKITSSNNITFIRYADGATQTEKKS